MKDEDEDEDERNKKSYQKQSYFYSQFKCVLCQAVMK